MESLRTGMQLSVRIWSRVLIGMVFNKAGVTQGHRLMDLMVANDFSISEAH